jgi:hypothetical protein
MTRDEFYDKYGDEMVQFVSYYKFTFTFVGFYAGAKQRIEVDFGGSSAEIYRFEIGAGDWAKVSDLQPFAGRVFDGDREVESFYDCA